jgi:signal transduction histidine kinase
MTDPTVWQATWFQAGAVLAAAAVLRALHRQRRRMAADRIHARLAGRIDERERIARELHDTYLQAVQGMVLHVHAAAQMLPRGEPGRGLLEAALERADDVFLEGRERILGLRHQMTGVAFRKKLEAYAHAWSGAGITCDIVVCGQERALHPIVCEEVYAIAREALANAFQHAQASHVRVLIAYGAGELTLVIEDDGRGIAPDIVRAGGVDGHWGMAGMRERAAGIDARLTIGARQCGSEVRLRLHAMLAYQQPERVRFWRRLGSASQADRLSQD